MSKNIKSLIKFPDNFLIGVGTSAYQIEGGWNADNKSPSIWDQYFEERNLGFDGKVACNSYNLLDEDIKNLIDLNVNIYRFSISWPRVLPNGDSRYKNQKGIQYYQNLIQKLLDNNIQPLVTIYHWDLPNILEELGGWTNPNIIDYFKDYATFVFDTFGDKVKLWCTINEPRILASGYASGSMAPGLSEKFSGIADSMVWRNLLLAHAAAYRIYETSFKDRQKGEITITIDTTGFMPNDPNNREDVEATERAYDYNMGVFVQPLVNGEFPESVMKGQRNTNYNENLKIRRLVEFTDEEKNDLIGSYDFMSFNYYFSAKVKALSLDTKDSDFQIVMSETAEPADLKSICEGFARVIDWLREKCNNPALFVTENGYAESPNEIDNNEKIKYHDGILRELYKAMNNGANVKGYTAWSFMDSLEWGRGYDSVRYGIYAVDFNDKEKRPRSEKPSTAYFKELFKTKTLPSVPK